MRLSYVSITNYRALRECELKLSPFVCIVGENNAGKSTILLALSLFFSGTKLSSSEFYNPLKPIRIEVTFCDIKEEDMNRIPPEHRERIQNLLVDGKLKLVRKYNTDGNSELLCRKLLPKDSRFKLDTINEVLRGNRGSALIEAIKEHLSEYSDMFNGIQATQSAIKDKIDEIISAMDVSQLKEQDQSLPTGIPNSIKSLFPEPILIPAVKDVTDDIKTKESATFGKLISILLKNVENAVEVQHIIESFGELHTLLNITKSENGDRVDNRLKQIQQIESIISGYLQESFPRVNLELRIPPPELKQVFSNAEILIDDGVKDTVETKGDGLKRAVTFALLRSYADGKKEVASSKEESIESRVIDAPYLFLFEEPELYLHPTAQRILFKALEKISQDHQVIVTTHSPLFFSHEAIGTFVKIIKEYPEDDKPYGRPFLIDLLEDISARDAFQLLCFENNSAAFFANKVVLVEGDSDLCFFKHVAKQLNPEWDFDAKNIPVIRIFGKGNVKKYKDFFSAFQIITYAILDLDVIISDFEKLEVSPEIGELRSKLLQEVDKIAQIELDTVSLPREKIKELVRRYSWIEKYNRLKELCKKIKLGEKINDDEVEEIELLFSEETNFKRKQILQKDISLKNQLLNALRKENIFVLSKGTVENYYPNGVTGEDKPTKALNACKLIERRECAMSISPILSIDGEQKPELIAIFEKIFS